MSEHGGRDGSAASYAQESDVQILTTQDLRVIGERQPDLDALDAVLETRDRYKFLHDWVQDIATAIKDAGQPLTIIHEAVCVDLGGERGWPYAVVEDSPCGRDSNLLWKQLIRSFRPTDKPRNLAANLVKLRHAALYEVGSAALEVLCLLSATLDDLLYRLQERSPVELPDNVDAARTVLNGLNEQEFDKVSEDVVKADVHLNDVLVQLYVTLVGNCKDTRRVYENFDTILATHLELSNVWNKAKSDRQRNNFLKALVDKAYDCSEPGAMNDPDFEAAWSKIVYVPCNKHMLKILESIETAREQRNAVLQLLKHVVRDDDYQSDVGDDDNMEGSKDKTEEGGTFDGGGMNTFDGGGGMDFDGGGGMDFDGGGVMTTFDGAEMITPVGTDEDRRDTPRAEVETNGNEQQARPRRTTAGKTPRKTPSTAKTEATDGQDEPSTRATTGGKSMLLMYLPGITDHAKPPVTGNRAWKNNMPYGGARSFDIANRSGVKPDQTEPNKANDPAPTRLALNKWAQKLPDNWTDVANLYDLGWTASVLEEELSESAGTDPAADELITMRLAECLDRINTDFVKLSSQPIDSTWVGKNICGAGTILIPFQQKYGFTLQERA